MAFSSNKFLWCLLFLSMQIFCYGQEPSTIPRPTSRPPISNPDIRSNGSDLVIEADTTTSDSTKLKRNTFATIFKGKPGRAALYSLVLPGGGQLYNKRWWKVPIAWGVDGFFTYRLIQHRKQYKMFDEIFKGYNAKPAIINTKYTEAQAKNFRSQARRNSEYGYVYLLIAHMVTVFDAYVDRHLKDFDLNEEISISPYTPYNTESLSLSNSLDPSYIRLARFTYTIK
jgi:hypothetical protein